MKKNIKYKIKISKIRKTINYKTKSYKYNDIKND